MIYPFVIIEAELFGDDCLLSVRYQLPEDAWSPMEIMAVELAQPHLWDTNGNPIKDLVTVDLRPVLNEWQLEYIEEKVMEALQKEAAQEALAA